MVVQLSLRAPKKMLRIRYDCRTFSTLPDLQKQYTVLVRNWFQVLRDVEDPTDKYEMFIEANHLAKTAKRSLKQ